MALNGLTCAEVPLRIGLFVLDRQRIRGFTVMRYINLRFTYLLTYLLTHYNACLDAAMKKLDQLTFIFRLWLVTCIGIS